MKLKYLIALLALAIAPFAAHSAVSLDTLPPTTHLLQSLEKYYHQKQQATVAEFDISEKKRWLKYLPSIGLGYNLGVGNDGQLKSQLRPTISYSTNIIHQGLQNKEARRAKINNIVQSNILALESEKRELLAMIKKYHFAKQDLQFQNEIAEIDQQLFAITTAAYEAAEIAPSTYLPKKRIFLTAKYQRFKAQQFMQEMKNDIRLKARF